MNLFKKYLLPLLFLLTPMVSGAQYFLNSGLKKNDIDEVYRQAVLENDRKNYPKAIELARKCTDRYPDNVDYNLLLGRLYLATKQYRMARQPIVKVLDKSPRYRDAYFYAINIELGEGNTPQALGYTNRALMKFPNDLEFTIKKLAILDGDRKYPAADAVAEDMLQRYPERPEAQKAFVGHHQAAGKYFADKGLLSQSKYHYEESLKVNPDNKEIITSLSSLTAKTGDIQSALQQVNMGLASNPYSYELLMKKLGMLQDMHQYQDAVAVHKILKAHYPNDYKVKQIDIDLKLDASHYYENTDPYVLYQSVLDANPGNREALNKLIGISMDRGVYRNALAWINKGLKGSPGDVTLLAKKADVLEILNNKLEASEIVSELWRKNPSSDALRIRAADLKVQAGKYYLNEKQFDKAQQEFEGALNTDPSNADAVNYMANLYIEQKDYENALMAIDLALQYREDDEQLLLKKVSVLADAGRYNEAFPFISKLISQHPDNPKYGAILTQQQLQAGKLLMNAEETEKALKQFKDVLAVNPANKDALNYVINLESGIGRPDTALAFVNLALRSFPEDKDFLLKKSSVLNELKQHHEASVIAYNLMTKYPYNKSYRAAYLDNLLASGGEFMKDEKMDEALVEYKNVLGINPYDSLALFAVVNIYNAQKQYDSALALTDKGLHFYKDNQRLIKQRAVTFENKGMYAEAEEQAERLVAINPSQANLDYANSLRGNLYKNQFGLYYMQSTYYLNKSTPYRVAMVEYRRFFAKGSSFAVRMAYGGRDQRSGAAYEADLYLKHGKKAYSYAFGSFSGADRVFPIVRVGYSLFLGVGRGWEVELGGRYTVVNSIDSLPNDPVLNPGYGYGSFKQKATVTTAVVSLAKTAGDFWFNMRAFFLFDKPSSEITIVDSLNPNGKTYPTVDQAHQYQAYQFTARYFMNKHQSYIGLTAGTGTSPDDRTRVILLPSLAGQTLSQFVNVHAQHTFNYRTTIGGALGWSNLKVKTDAYQNQFDIYLSLTQKF